MPRHSISVMTLLLRHHDVGPPPGSCAAADPTAWRAFAVLADLPAERLAGTVFLIDADGWLRMLQRPGAEGKSRHPKICWRQNAMSRKIQSSRRTEATMATNTNPTTPPNRVLYATMGLLLVVLLFGAGGFLWLSNGSGGNNPGLSIGGAFTLQDGNGKPVTDQDFRGSYMLVYFGYTFCPTCAPRRSMPWRTPWIGLGRRLLKSDRSSLRWTRGAIRRLW